MFGASQGFGQQQSNQNTRFQPANPALNSQADGKQNQIGISCLESRIEYLRNGRQQKPLGMGMIGSQQTNVPMFGGLQQQPTQTFQPFGQSQTPSVNQGVTQTNMFGQQSSQGTAPLFGQPQQTSLAPSSFNLGGSSIQQPAQPQSGGLFGSLGQQPQSSPATGLFGSLNQTQQPQQTGLNLGQNFSLQTPQQQQTSLFGGLQQNQSLLQTQAPQSSITTSLTPISALPQLPSGFKYIVVEDKNQQGADQEQYDDYDYLQKQHLEKMEQNILQNTYPLISYPPDNYNYGRDYLFRQDQYQPKIQRVHLQKSSFSNNSTSQLPQKAEIYPKNQQLQQFRNQYKSLSSKSKRTPAMDDKLIGQRLSQMAIQPEKGFYLVCTQCPNPVKCFIELSKLKINDSNATIADLIIQLQNNFLKINDEEPQYQALFTPDGQPFNQAVLSNDLLLDNLELTSKSQMVLVQVKTNQSLRLSSQSQKHKISFGAQEEDKKKPNPNAPSLKNLKAFQMSPSIEQLRFLNDYELSEVKNFEVFSDYGHLKFLQPVDLRGLQLDSIIQFSQDTVEFYGQDDSTPPRGTEINVPCQITFFNFGNGTQEFRQLKENDFQKFTEDVQQQVDDMNMKLIHLDQEKLVVETQQL